MTDCQLCSFNGELLFEEGPILVGLPKKPAVPGHAIAFPKQHIQILEQATNEQAEKLVEAANKASIAMFEGLKAQGTNIIIMNGTAAGQKTPHLSIDIIPRFKGDGLNFQWPTRKLTEEQMDIAEMKIREEASRPAAIISERKEELPEPEKEKPRKPHKKPKEDIFMKQLRRLP
ncbi:HIT family protein [Candidatus Woesearchaeota archaeon]|nr:HIT family protein [Candidatus Woesearchaeota archaeon]